MAQDDTAPAVVLVRRAIRTPAFRRAVEALDRHVFDNGTVPDRDALLTLAVALDGIAQFVREPEP